MRTQILKNTLWILILLSILTSIALNNIDSGLRSGATPHGIVSFEFCAYMSSCDDALSQWGETGRALAMLSLGMDYLFLILYPGLIFTGLLLVSSHVPRNLFRPTMAIAWSCPAISLADAIENYALIQIILSESGSCYGLLASVFATIKFVLLGITLLWLLIAIVRYVMFNRPVA